jgi:uncharacterized repeat protein (TIGR01451 family)
MRLSWLSPGRKRLRRSLLAVGTAALLAPLFVTSLPATAAPVDDTPIVPRYEKSIEPDEELRSDLFARDAYYETRRVTGDNQLSIEQAGRLRAVAAQQARKMGAAQPAVSPFGPWSAAGPNPIVQIGRTSGGAEAISGRIGALAIQPGTGRLILGAAQGGIWTYDTASGTWTARTDDQPSLAIGALAVAPSNPNVVYAGTGEGALSGDSYYGNGVMRSTDGGTTWTNVSGTTFDGVATAGLAVDPTNADHLYVAIGRGRSGIRRVTPPTSTVYGIYESTNGGTSWTLRKGTTDQFRGATDIDIDPRTPSILYASFWGDAMYKSTDAGAHWTPIMSGLPADADFAAGATRFSIGLSHPQGQSAVLYVGFDYVDKAGKHQPGRVWKSTNEGASWSQLPGGSGPDAVENYCGVQCFYDNVIEVDPTNPDIVYVAGQYNYGVGSGGIYRSTDGGATWLSLGYDLHPDFHAVAIQPDAPGHVLIGNDGGVWYSADHGGRLAAGAPLSAADWQDLNGTVDPATAAVTHRTGLQITQFTSISTVPPTPARIWGGSQDNGTERRSVASNTWFDVAGGDGGQVLVDPNTGGFVFGTFFGISPYRFSTASPGFFTNQSISHGINLADRAEFYIPWVMNQANPNQLFLGTYRLYRTNNAEDPSAGAVTWSPISPDLTSGCTGTAPNGARGCFLSAIGLADGGDAVYTGSDDGYLYVSENAVTSATPSWKRVDKGALPARPVTQFAVDRSDWRTAFVAYAGFNGATPNKPGHVFATDNGGKSWKDVSGNLPDVPVNSLILDPSSPTTLYAGTDVGAFVTTNGGASWSALAAGLPVVSVWQLSYDPSHRLLAAGTHGRGAFTATNPTPSPALVVSKSDSGVPVGPGSDITYTLKVRNIGNAAGTGVGISDLIPVGTTFVSASDGGTLSKGRAVWSGLTVPAGGSRSVTLTVRISNALDPSVTSIVNDRISVTSAQGVGTSSSPHVTPIAPAHGTSVLPATQTDGTRVGQSLDYHVNVRNAGYLADSYHVTVSGNAFPTQVLDSTCSAPLGTTPSVAPGGTTDVCVRVSVPAGTANAATDHATVTATSVGDPSVSGSAAVTTIAVAVDTLLVDDDNNAPDVKGFYQTALADSGTPYSFWDLGVDKNLPVNYVRAHKNVVWFTGASYPGPVVPYEPLLKAYLDGGGRLFMSGDDILDQAAGTTAFVHDYLHVAWDGTEAQNDKATAAVHGVAGSPVTDGIGTVPLDRSVLGGVNFSDQITPVAPATPAFTDDSAQADGLSVDNGTYKVVFVAFPFEEYGSAADKANLMHRVLTYLG